MHLTLSALSDIISSRHSRFRECLFGCGANVSCRGLTAMGMYENFTTPTELNHRHLAVFFIQLAVMILSFFICVNLVFFLEESQGSFFASVVYDMKAHEGEEKLFRKLPLFDSDEERIVTDKTIDLEKGGIWLTERQDVMFTACLLGGFLAGVILVFSGVGSVYKQIRNIIVIITKEFIPYVIFLVTIGLWHAAICILLYIAAMVTLIFAPLILLVHLVLGVIQTMRLTGKKTLRPV